jgi:hypothetical protein
MRTKLTFATLLIALLALIVPVAAQDMMQTPSVSVQDQVSTDGTVTIDAAFSAGPGWVVIHADNGEGAPGPVIGFRGLNTGDNVNIAVEIDVAAATPTLFAMLHSDTGVVGEYEFGSVEGADGPVAVDGNVVTPSFTAEIARVHDQFVDMNSITATSVVTAEDGWLVVHADGGGRPGPVIGQTFVEAGTNLNVSVDLDAEGITDTLWPMMHRDTGEPGTYEFGAVEGADGPIAINGVVSTFPVTAGTPAMRIADQIVTDTLAAESVLAEVDGWLVVHADGGGQPGPVIGFAQVFTGTNLNVQVELDAESVTPVLYPMLHIDTGAAGEYEFGSVEGADGPVTVDGSVLTFPINAAPAITYEGTLDGTTLTIADAQIDDYGWMVVHADGGGQPGPVIGFTPLLQGYSAGIVVELDEAGLTETVYPMLHYDTGEAGAYEFGQVEGADGPVAVDGAVVTGPLTPEAAE